VDDLEALEETVFWLSDPATRAAIRTARLNDLPPRVLPAVVEFMYGPLAREPKRVGKPLVGELAGLWSARRGTFRVLYEVRDQEVVVLVVRAAVTSSGS
jgi:mRNA-degrading endonuclease RelE of RelBE toxin-antitoxin system